MHFPYVVNERWSFLRLLLVIMPQVLKGFTIAVQEKLVPDYLPLNLSLVLVLDRTKYSEIRKEKAKVKRDCFIELV